MAGNPTSTISAGPWCSPIDAAGRFCARSWASPANIAAAASINAPTTRVIASRRSVMSVNTFHQDSQPVWDERPSGMPSGSQHVAVSTLNFERGSGFAGIWFGWRPVRVHRSAVPVVEEVVRARNGVCAIDLINRRSMERTNR